MRWISVAVWMIIIFLLSTDHFSSAKTESLFPQGFDFFVRKLAHWTEYFVLAMLVIRALTPVGQSVTQRDFLFSVAIATGYAITDEWHQSFVRSRNAQASDVAIDAFGAVCGSYSWKVLGRFLERPQST